MKELRILIADDHTLMRRGTRGYLQSRRGWRVVGEAVNGNEALEKVDKLRPDVVILDISMPDLDGLEAIRQIRGRSPQVKILVLSMHESVQMVRRVMQAGAQGYVLKSDLGECLVQAVQRITAGERFLTTRVSGILLENALEVERRTERTQGQVSPRESEIISLLAEGKNNKEIASILGIAVRTVDTHRTNIMHKLGLHSLADLIHYAIRHNLHKSVESAIR